jgi:hypothetical protein
MKTLIVSSLSDHNRQEMMELMLARGK